jgi:HEAT repeat protein
MASRQRILPVVVVLAFLGGFAWLVLRPHEPVFEGKPVSLVLDEGYYNSSRLKAERALRALGTNALPMLVNMAGTRLTTFRMIVGSMARDPSMAFLHLPPQRAKHEIAAWGFKQLGPAGRPAVPALIQLLDDRDPGVQGAAAQCLAGIGPAAQEAVPALVRLLKAHRGAARWPNDRVLASAVRALGEIGPAASAAIPYLADTTNDVALLALIKIRQGSFQPFFDRLKDTSDAPRWSRTAAELSGLGTNADPAIPLLVAAFQHTNKHIPHQAVFIVGQLHRRPEVCLPALVSLLNSTNKDLRADALNALRSFGPAAKPAAPEIVRCLNDNEAWLRDLATNALRAIDPTAAGVSVK